MFPSGGDEKEEKEERGATPPLPPLPHIPPSPLSSTPVPALISAPLTLSSALSPVSATPRYSLLVDVPEENPPPSHVPARVDFLAQCDRGVEYDSLHPPPPHWLPYRHRTFPAVFRDTFSSFVYWTAEQQRDLRGCFEGWDSDDSHPFRGLYGDVSPSATRLKPSAQRQNTQSHTVQYYVDRLHARQNKAIGLIMYNVKIHTFLRTQSFRFGPAVCDFYQCDLYQSSPADTELTMIVGMKNTWTPVHVDDGGDSTWSLAVEGSKVWIFGRPEDRADFTRHFDRSFTWIQLKPTDRQFLTSHHCIMIHQRPGDIIYVPAVGRTW